MAITPGAGFMVDPNNSNGVVPIGSAQSDTPQVGQQSPGGTGSYTPTQQAPTQTYQAPTPQGAPSTPATPTPTPTPQPPINTSQPSPQGASSYVVKPGDTLSQIAQAQGTTVAALMAANPSITNADKINSGQSLNLKYNNALTQVQGTSVPSGAGDASAAVKDATKTTQDAQQTQAGADAAKAITDKLNNDPGYQQLVKDQNDYLSSQNQTKTLQEQYTDLTNSLGIPALNTSLINMKAVMDGTEQDIRNEITKAGGFATDSQVLALTTARNKTMIQNYNNLLQTRDDLVNQVTTTMGFAKEDAANATALATEKMNYDQKIIDYTQKMQSNATDGYNKIISTPGYGYKALYDSTGGDAHTISLIETSLGLSPGSLKSLADQNAQTWSDPYKLGGDYVQKNNLTGEIRTAVNNPTGSGSSDPNGGVTLPGDPTSQSILSQTGLSIAAFGYLTQGSAALTRMSAAQRLQYMNEAQTWANKNGIDLSTFSSQYDAYNKALQSNISRVNNVKVAEGELTGTLANLGAAADDASFNSMKWENVAKLFAGQQFNDPSVSKYAFHLNQLRSELALYNSAAAGKTSTDQADQAEADRIIKDGFAAGGITGFQNALKASVDKMDNTLSQNVTRTNQQVWSLFGVTKPTQSLGTKADQSTVEALLNKNGYNYNDLVTKMMAPGAIPQGTYPAIDAVTGKPFAATKEEIKSGKYIAL